MKRLLIAMALPLTLSTCAGFGRTPRGERLERIQNSPNYRDGKFQNKTPAQVLTTNKPTIIALLSFLFRSSDGLRPEIALPTVKTDLHRLDRNENILIWMGHSSIFIQTNGRRILIDPVLVRASPVAGFNKAFKGTEIYKPEDIPDIDYLVITHDHYDHLDYKTVLKLKDRAGKIICGLGVGEHFEYWGFDKNRIIELDWNENTSLENGFTFYCLPARHFSGRSLSSRDTTLWTSWLLQTPSRNIYISGDTGYDVHFAEISRQFEKIDLAIIENGQYDENWEDIHLMPDKLVKAAKDLHAKKLITVHNSKYTLANHSWQEPLVNISAANETESLNLLTPMIGEPVYLDDTAQTFDKWWELPQEEK